MKRSILSVVLAAMLVLTGCGNSEDEQAKTAISGYLMKQQEQNKMISLKKGEADCISNGMVDNIGVDQLKKYGFLNEDGSVNEKVDTPDMSKEDAKAMVNSMFNCTDVMKTMQAQLTASMGNQPAAVKDCFDKALTADAVRGMLVGSLSGDQQQAQQELLGPLMQCASMASGAPTSPSPSSN
jgi:hypothetical protein